METVSESDTNAASDSRHQNTHSHSTWPLLSGSGSPSFDHPLETNNPSAGIAAVPNAVFQRRRVNPETLALKLGPDLVRDLEALIQPGVIEMPSFAVRKRLQERYSIDRRHIYDYFHSRGLRVIKADKNGNGNAIVPKDLTPALASPKPNLRVRISCRAPTKEPPRVASTANLVSKRKGARPPVGSKSGGVTKARSGRRRQHARSTHGDPPPPAAVHPSSRTVQPISPLPQHISATNNNHEFDPAVSPEEFYSFAQAMDETSDMHGGTPVFDLRGGATRLGSSPRTTSADPLSPNFYTLSATEHLAFYPPLYPPLSGAFDTCDIHECTGTYRAYMQERSRLYYEELLPVPYDISRNEQKQAPSGDYQSVSCNGSEFRRWVDPEGTHVLDKEKIVLKKKSCKSGASTIRQKTSPALSLGIDNEAQSLEALFPILDQNRTSIDNLGVSPIVHTPCQSHVPLDFCFLLNTESGDVEDHLLDRTTSSSGASMFPECSAPLRLKIRGQSLHGHPDFPRSSPLLPPAELRHADVNPKSFTPPLQQPTSSLSVHEMGTFKNSRNNLSTPTRFAPRTPPKFQLREYDEIKMKSFTSHSTRRRTTSAGGGI